MHAAVTYPLAMPEPKPAYSAVNALVSHHTVYRSVKIEVCRI
jgi:hypothetical protein